jgi:CheY-like chemotaxis protein
MGGDITVTSAAGTGSSFRFVFHGPTTSEVPRLSETFRRVTGLVPGQGELRVLVVDDQSTNRELLRGMLEPLGFIVDEACDGEESIAKVQARTPRIILMDLVMPGMNGVETTQVLRGTYTMEALTIIGITDSAFEKEKQQFLDSGVNAYIAKPFREQELYDVLAGHAGVLFETEGHEEVTENRPSLEVPSFDKMSPEWREAFKQALARKNVTRIRKLGEEAKERDALLSAWLLERVALYDLEGLKKLGNGDAV